MFFEDVSFPLDLGSFAKGGRSFKTTINVQDNGYETRNQNWSDNKGKWSIPQFALLNASGTLGYYDLDNLHKITKGCLHGFRFRAPLDYTASIYEGILNNGYGNGKPALQLSKKIIDGSGSYYQDIKKPVSGTLNLFKNGIEITSGFSVNYTNGLVTFNPSVTLSGVVASGSNSCIVTSANHGLTNGTQVYLLSSNQLVNQLVYTISNVTTNTFNITLTTAININVSIYVYPQITDVLSAIFEYDYPVRFDNDEPFDAGMQEDGLIHVSNVSLVELRI